MRRTFNLIRDDRGTSLIEMALLVPFLTSMVIGMIDVSRGYSAKLQLEQAAQRAIEKAMNNEKDTTMYQTLRAEAASAAEVEASAVQVRYWLECNGVSQNTNPSTMDADYEKKCDNGVAYARYVSVQITKAYEPMFRVKMLGSNADGTFTLVGKSGIRVQ